MPTSERGEFENPIKSAYSIEYYDSRWELEHMKNLEKDKDVKKWTKNHAIRIAYFDRNGKYRTFAPDFLVEMKGGLIEIHEIKGTHLLDHPITKKKIEAAREWCKARKIKFKIISKY